MIYAPPSFNVDIGKEISNIEKKRGWGKSARGPLPFMEEAGLSEEEMIVEYLT